MKTPLSISAISVVIPVFNSEKTLSPLFLRIQNAFRIMAIDLEIVLINDGSTDQSWEIIESLVSRNPGNTTGINLATNYGQHNATLCGFRYCKFEHVLTIDDDLQFQPEDIDKLVGAMRETNADVIYGIPTIKEHHLIRNAGSSLAKYLSFKLPKNSSSFRLIKDRIVKEILDHPYHQQSIFIDLVMNWHTSYIRHIPVNHIKRKEGNSNYSLAKLFRMYLDIIINYTAFPLKVITYFGLATSLLTLFMGIRFIYKKVFFDVPLGYTSIIVSTLFSTSIILFSLGIIGQYIYRLYMVQSKKPSYSINKIIK